MGKPTGFLEYTRVTNGDVPPSERIKTYDEFHTPLNDEARQQQAARCMNCGVPFCQSAMELKGMVTGCPLHNLIPEWNDEIYRGHIGHAYSRLHKTSNFPEFTGRVCPALCEKACINGQYTEPVTVHDNELYLIEKAWANGEVTPQIPKVRSGKKIAVIGSGPSGLAVADTLNHRGHSVTVFERDDRIGGLLMYGIPNMKLDKSVIARRQQLMEAEGVEFTCGVDVGKDISAEHLREEFDAIVLCTGAKEPRSLAAADPSVVDGVYFAVDFLRSTTRHLLSKDCRSTSVKDFNKFPSFVSARGKDVIVVGGGDTGNDCIATVIRHGCRSVTALEMMPKPPVERAESNPWPEWPKTLKTDYGHEEAIEVFGEDPRVYETTVKEVKCDDNGNLTSVVTVKVAFKNGKLTEVEGSEKELPCQLLLIAAGFVGAQKYTPQAFGLGQDGRGRIGISRDAYATEEEGIFAAGDCHRGQSLVVWAIAEGRACAKEVDEYLMGYTQL